MRIRTKLWFVNGLVVAITVAVAAMLVLTHSRLPRMVEQSERAHLVASEIAGLARALDDYHFARLARARPQWRSSVARIERHLDELEGEHGEARLTRQLATGLQQVDELYSTLPANPPLEPSVLEGRIHDQISATLHDMLVWSRLLSASIRDELAAAQMRANLLVIGFAVAVVITMNGIYAFFRRTVLAPLGGLEQGVESVRRGDLEHLIEPRADDELGQLTHAFNGMTTSLRQLSREREEFISTAAHELKTPVAVIKTSVQLMMRRPHGWSAAELLRSLARLDRQCNRLSRLIADVLEVSRLELKQAELDRRPTDVAEIVEDVVRDFEGVDPRHRLVLVRMDAVLAEVDRDRLEHVLTNLIDNAIKYSPDGGDVEIDCRRVEGDAVVSVRDYGIGIPADRRARVFERFYRAHAGTPYEHVGSLGVGLYLSREIIARHGGAIWFESEEGRGSTFSFRIPAGRAHEEAAE